MFTARARKGLTGLAVATVTLIALTGCASSNPLDSGSSASAGGGGSSIVVGSQDYYSNEIIAEIYAQALEGAGQTVDRKFTIGQRDAYIPLLENGTITLFPEYTGNLLQFFDKTTTARTSADVYAALPKALPSGLEVLDQSTATDGDSYTVTKAFADKYNLKTIADLSKVTEPLTLGGNAELAQRPYGPTGLKDTYSVDVAFSATGATTVDDLVAGTVNIANVYTSEPRIQTDNLVVLQDPKGLFLSSNVVPVVNSKVAAQVKDVINKVSAKLTPEGLVALNVESTVDQKSPADIAKKWLSDNGLS
ncbi:ABC transporter substrate-binding protein [Microbacterium sp. CJ88]|uniref:ABC transporter substrate-binding protein n=1 Tax=Microbacterium sp. CJ88 TaxID=3445672 RepID=UPI003F6558E0